MLEEIWRLQNLREELQSVAGDVRHVSDLLHAGQEALAGPAPPSLAVLVPDLGASHPNVSSKDKSKKIKSCQLLFPLKCITRQTRSSHYISGVNNTLAAVLGNNKMNDDICKAPHGATPSQVFTTR